jgi:putative FmdB family regulatory protein
MTEADVPTYQYACTACGHQLEAVQSFADEPLTACPTCEGRLRKLFSSVGVVFKGSGFYRNDSRSEQATKIESAPKTDKKSETKTESSTPSTPSTTSSSSGSSSTPANSAAA